MTLMDSENSKRLRYVGAAGVSLLAIFAVVATLGGSLGWLRAIPWVVGLWVLWVVVVMAALSLSLTVDRPDYKRLVFIIVCIALGLRGVALVTSPILEIDYYRYLWDGKVLAEGVSPYAYSPAQILDADKANPRRSLPARGVAFAEIRKQPRDFESDSFCQTHDNLSPC